MHEVLVNRLGGLSLPRKSVVRLTDRPDMTLDVYRGRKTTIQQQLQIAIEKKGGGGGGGGGGGVVYSNLKKGPIYFQFKFTKFISACSKLNCQ